MPDKKPPEAGARVGPEASPETGFGAGLRSGLRSGLRTGLPVAIGYVPIAFSFGVAATRAGLTAGEAVALSAIIYAGASQFLALALFASGAPVILSALTLIAMNLRHVLYGPALLKEAGPRATARLGWAWAWGLTDEVFGATLGALRQGRLFGPAFMFGVGGIAYAAWVSGTAAGALAGGGALDAWPAVNAGLGFMLPALFLALLLSILTKAAVPVVAVAAAATVAVTLALSPTSGILAGMLAGAVSGVAAGRKGAA